MGYPSPVHIYDYDLTTMYPNHGNVRAPTRELAEHMNYEFLYPFVRERGYTIGDYGWTTLGFGDADPIQLQQTAGGPDPGILRNNYGLNNVVGLLVESFVHPLETPLASFERRVGGHLAVMEGVLQYGHENAGDIIAAKRESERLNREQPMNNYVEGESSATMHAVYETEEDLRPLWALHGLPSPFLASGAWQYHADHGRGGLVGALLEPVSSRNVADGRPGQLDAHPDRSLHADYGTAPRSAVAVQQDGQPPATETTPMPLAVALLALLFLAGRRAT